MKVCSKCGHNKEPTDFNKYSRNKTDGLRADCRECQSKQTVIDSENRRRRNMNQGRFNSIYNGLPQNLKKVYDVVPIKDSWNEIAIMAELSRLNISYSGEKSMIGNLNRLKELGLIKECASGKFSKIEITEKVEKKVEVMQKKEVKMSQLTPIELISSLSAQAIQLANLCRKLSEDIDYSAILIDDHIKAQSKDSEKLKQLQALLKG